MSVEKNTIFNPYAYSHYSYLLRAKYSPNKKQCKTSANEMFYCTCCQSSHILINAIIVYETTFGYFNTTSLYCNCILHNTKIMTKTHIFDIAFDFGANCPVNEG